MRKVIVVHLIAHALIWALPEPMHHPVLELPVILQVHLLYEIAEKAVKKKKGDPPDSDR